MVFIGVTIGLAFTILCGIGIWAIENGGISRFQQKLTYGLVIGMGVFALVGAVLQTIIQLNQ